MQTAFVGKLFEVHSCSHADDDRSGDHDQHQHRRTSDGTFDASFFSKAGKIAGQKLDVQPADAVADNLDDQDTQDQQGKNHR